LSDLLLKRLKPSLHKAYSHFNRYIPTSLLSVKKLIGDRFGKVKGKTAIAFGEVKGKVAIAIPVSRDF